MNGFVPHSDGRENSRDRVVSVRSLCGIDIMIFDMRNDKTQRECFESRECHEAPQIARTSPVNHASAQSVSPFRPRSQRPVTRIDNVVIGTLCFH